MTRINAGIPNQLTNNKNKVMNWKTVDELLKPIDRTSLERVDVLVFTDKWTNVMMGYYFPCLGTYEAFNAGSCNVTHWMPLPEPPKVSKP